MMAGCSMRLSTPPSDSAQAKIYINDIIAEREAHSRTRDGSYLNVLEELARLSEAALEPNGDHTAKTLHLLLRQLMLRVRWEARVDHFLHYSQLITSLLRYDSERKIGYPSDWPPRIERSQAHSQRGAPCERGGS